MKVQPVDMRHIYGVWDQVEPYLSAAFAHSNGEYNAEHAKVYLATGAWVLLVFVDGDAVRGAAVVEFLNRPNDRIAFIVGMGGKHISTQDNADQFKHIMRLHGATKIECSARTSTARLWRSKFGLQDKCVIMETRL